MNKGAYIPQPIPASDLPDDWSERVREAMKRDRQVAGPGPDCDILVLDPGSRQWHRLLLPGNGYTFSTPEDRDQILERVRWA